MFSFFVLLFFLAKMSAINHHHLVLYIHHPLVIYCKYPCMVSLEKMTLEDGITTAGDLLSTSFDFGSISHRLFCLSAYRFLEDDDLLAHGGMYEINVIVPGGCQPPAPDRWLFRV